MESTKQAQVTKETKKRIVVDYEGKLTFWERLLKKLKTFNTWANVVVGIIKFLLMLGVSFVILFPFVSRIAGSFMTRADIMDPTVALIPKTPTLEIYQALIVENRYFEALLNTLLIALLCALIQTLVSCLVGYGLAKFKFKGNKVVMLLVIITMIIPTSTLKLSMIHHVQNFDILQVISWGFPKVFSLFADSAISIKNTVWPYVILSVSGVAFKNGLYIYLMRQFFKGVPDELEESAYVDGSGPYRTFFRIIMPLAVPMMITVFLFSFSWQWTDEFYAEVFRWNINGPDRMWLMPDIYSNIPGSLTFENFSGQHGYNMVIRNTAGMLIILPLIIMYLFCQRYLVEGIERSGIVG